MMFSSCSSKDNAESVSQNVETAATLRQKDWREIAPRDIKGNVVSLFADDWFEVAAGSKDSLNLMTIAWGSIGVLWNRPVVTVYVSTSRYTNEYLDSNDYFTITHFPPSMRQTLQYLGSVSGRDEDKVKGADLTVQFTELGNPIFAEADLAIECRKIYAQPFEPSLMQLEQREWYDQRGLGYHVAYTGEILHVWQK